MTTPSHFHLTVAFKYYTCLACFNNEHNYLQLSFRTPHGSSPELTTLQNSNLMKLVPESICVNQGQVMKQISPSSNNYIQAVAGDSHEKQAINNIFDSLILNTPHKMWPSDTSYLDASTEVSLTKKTFTLRTYISQVDLWFMYRYATSGFKFPKQHYDSWNDQYSNLIDANYCTMFCFFSFTHSL